MMRFVCFPRLAFFVCLGVLPVLWGCPQKEDKGKGEASGSAGAGSAAPRGPGGGGSGRGGPGGRGGGAPLVEVVELKRSQSATVVSLPVVLEGRKQVEVYPRLAGRVKDILRDTGVKVARGVTLFHIDRSEPGESFLPVPVTSPISGFVAQWYVAVGDQLQSGDRALLVVDDSALRARVWLPAQEWQEVDSQTSASLAVGGTSKPARLVNVARAVQASAGKGLVEIEVPNENGSWKAGFSATARFELAPKMRLLVPARALLLTSDGSFVYFVEGDGEELKTRRQKVSFVARTPDMVELVKTGDEELPADGARVVVSGTGRLSDGGKVRVAK